jgi:hypothetical protein
MVTNYAFTYATRDDSASVLQGGELATYRKRKRERERVREREIIRVGQCKFPDTHIPVIATIRADRDW